ncbi:putative transcriptional regulatory protein [Cercospora beticola]|uniref:Putative transcriptional regulatory protein n=1 Tax=Cercospora beticola TaxID=122368 RepID=A0A2G5HJY6_CERBT|nr:putative transcriptional regulatory protein [Cercospora beticola]PIA92848.1 putative transcriptional regulatory protein [Cercospora beticola]WPB01954.1 hypothetical protein RHO25_006587 [Cercospora beticola]CAK1363200.1 unnamed protein product [Cercospora beticola]
MAPTSSSTASASRPYRSHKVPACDLCRRRKIHCNVDVPGQSCRFCRERDLTCEFRQKRASDAVEQRPAKRSRANRSENRNVPQEISSKGSTIGITLSKQGERSLPADLSPGQIHAQGICLRNEHLSPTVLGQGTTTPSESLAQFPSVAGTSPNESSLMLNPPMAEDIEVLEHYLTSHGAARSMVAKPYSVISTAPGKPIVYLTVPRRRQGLRTENEPGQKQREIMENVLGKLRDHVVELYFTKMHPCFPIIDEKTFKELWVQDRTRISSPLLCDIYAAALHFWHTSPDLQPYPQPDLSFMYNQAVSALQEDFLESTITTVHAALLDLVGRPVMSISGNIITLGRTVTLAHSLGLHRNPANWRATEHEKNVRVRLWWGVLVHDHWASLAHGTPPLIQSQNCDVPLPNFDTEESHISDTQSSQSLFVQLCKLSQILGQLLPFVYTLKNDPADTMRSLRRVECLVDDWETELPASLQHAGSGDCLTNGVSNLRFCHLTIKLLLCRIAFKTTTSDVSASPAEARPYRLGMLREAAFLLIDFVTALTQTQLSEFWLPYTAHLLVTAATITLRCLLESTDTITKRTCVEKLAQFRDRLQKAKAESNWDLADFCLERCAEPIDKICASMRDVLPVAVPASKERGTATSSQQSELEDAALDFDFASWSSDFLLPVDNFDYPFDALWSVPG